jgi:hypothetical protein
MIPEDQKASVALMLHEAGKNCKPVLSETQVLNAQVLAQSETRRTEANENARAFMRQASQRRY